MTAPRPHRSLVPAPRAKALTARPAPVVYTRQYLLLARTAPGCWAPLADDAGEPRCYPDLPMAVAAATAARTGRAERVVVVAEGDECLHCAGPAGLCDCVRCACCDAYVATFDDAVDPAYCGPTCAQEARDAMTPEYDDGPE